LIRGRQDVTSSFFFRGPAQRLRSQARTQTPSGKPSPRFMAQFPGKSCRSIQTKRGKKIQQKIVLIGVELYSGERRTTSGGPLTTMNQSTFNESSLIVPDRDDPPLRRQFLWPGPRRTTLRRTAPPTAHDYRERPPGTSTRLPGWLAGVPAISVCNGSLSLRMWMSVSIKYLNPFKGHRSFSATRYQHASASYGLLYLCLSDLCNPSGAGLRVRFST